MKKTTIFLPFLIASVAMIQPIEALAQDTENSPCHDKLLSYATWQETPATEWALDLETPAGGKLRYLGATHSNNATHPQFVELREAWQALKPTIAFFEGPDRGTAASEAETIAQLGESGYVRFLAKEAGIKTHSLEPGPQDQMNYLLSLKKFTPEQIKLFFILREASRLREAKGMSKEQVKATIAQLLPMANQMVPLFADVLPDTASLQPAFEKYWSAPAEWWQAPAAWFDPLKSDNTTGGNFTNEINRHNSEFRNLHMYRLLTDAVLRGERVFAVVGRNHVPMQAAAIRCALE